MLNPGCLKDVDTARVANVPAVLGPAEKGEYPWAGGVGRCSCSSQRVVRDAAQALAEPPQFARGCLLDLLALGLQPAAEPGGHVVRVRSHARTALPSASSASRCPGRGRSRSSCPGAARQGPPPPGRIPRRSGSEPRRARPSAPSSPGSTRAGRLPAQGRPAASPPRCRRDGPGNGVRCGPFRAASVLAAITALTIQTGWFGSAHSRRTVVLSPDRHPRGRKDGLAVGPR